MTRPTNLGRTYPRVSSLGTMTTDLGDLADVDLSGIADGDIIIWDATAGEWIVGPLPSSGALEVTDGTTTVSPATTIDFDPTFFDVTAPGGDVAAVTFVGASGSTVDIEDEGSPEGAADTIDFVGAGVSVAFAAGTATVTIAGGGGGGLPLIAETILGVDAADITITGIPNTYRSLLIHISARSAVGGEFGTLNMRMGDGSIDTGSNYSSSRDISGSGAATLGGRIAATLNLATIAGNTATAGAFGYVEVTVLNYKNTAMMKGVLSQSYMDGASDHYQGEFGGQYRSTSAEVDQIRIYDSGGANLKAGSYMTIYGIG